MNTKPIRDQLDLSLEALVESRQDAAFERLHTAVSMLVKALEETDRELSRAANVASCLANGIQPD